VLDDGAASMGWPDIDFAFSPSDDPDAKDKTIYEPPYTAIQIIDVAPLRDDHNQTLGYYLAVCSGDPAAIWKGAEIWEEVLTDLDYQFLDAMPTQATMGGATAALSDSGVDPSVFDKVNTVEVVLHHGELESVTPLAVLNGQNRALLGDEVIGFTTATLTGHKTYTLSNLLRGQRNTEIAMGTHTATDSFVLLNGPGVVFKPTNKAAFGRARNYKAIPAGAEEVDVDAVAHTHACATMRCFAPCHVDCTRSGVGNNDITFTWTRRSRAIIEVFSCEPVPLLEARERYEVDVYDDDTFTTIVRTISIYVDPETGGTGATAHYTAAEQTSDGLTPGDPVNIRMYQLSETLGRGNYWQGAVQ